MKHLKIGAALVVGLGAAWLVARPDTVTGATRPRAEARTSEARAGGERATRRSAAPRVDRSSAAAPAEEPVTELVSRVRDTVGRAAIAFHDYLEANPNRLHEMCRRGATKEEYAAEAARVRAEVAKIAGGEVGEVILQAPDPGCRRTYDDWLADAVANVLLGSELTDPAVFARMQGDAEGREASRTLGELVANSDSDQERIAALVLLQRSNGERAALPVAAYAGIAEKSATEIQLLLDPHGSVPLPAEALSDVRALALDANQPAHVRKSALTALGHKGTAAQLTEVVDTVLGDPATARNVLGDLGPALATCGRPCLGTLEKLATSPDEGLRFAAYRASLEARPDDKAAFNELILKTQSVAFDLDPEEQNLRRELLQLE